MHDHPAVDTSALVRNPVETPKHILEKSTELGHTLWAIVIHEANQYTQARCQVPPVYKHV